MLLKCYLQELPEPLFVFSLQDYGHYRKNRARYTENDCSVLRSKLRQLHPVHRASLGALLRHLLRVASHSGTNGVTVKALVAHFRDDVLRGHRTLGDVKIQLLEDLVQNADTLFAERSSPSPPFPSPHVAETMSTFTYGSLFRSPELPQPAEVEATGSTTQHGPGLVGGIPTSTQSFFSSSPSDAATPSPTALLSPLLGLPSSKTLTEGVELTTQEQVIPEVRETNAVGTPPNSIPGSIPLTSVAEWRLRQSQLSPHPEALTVPQSPPGSVLSSISDFPLSSATSLQTGMGRFS